MTISTTRRIQDPDIMDKAGEFLEMLARTSIPASKVQMADPFLIVWPNDRIGPWGLELFNDSTCWNHIYILCQKYMRTQHFDFRQ